MPADILYISKFLNTPGVEGPQQLCGYAPGKPGNFTGRNQDPSLYTAIAASGVTIATGCDLGQTNADTMLGYGLDRGVVNSLRPYFGLKRQDAICKLSSLPLTIAKHTADAIDHAVHGGYLRYVVAAYDRESSVPFADLPKQAQAVIFSLCFQKGCTGVRTDWPKVWGHLVLQDWPRAVHELETGFSQYKLRRSIEGKLLREVC